MAHKFNNTIEELNYVVTGREEPLLLSHREKMIIFKIAEYLDKIREVQEEDK